MGRLICTIFLVTATFLCHASDSTKLLVAGSFKNFYVDNFKNIYTVSYQNQLKKLNTNGDSISVFNDTRRYGNIFSVDVTNPLKIYIHYADYNTVLVLDRFLHITNTLNFNQLQLYQISNIAMSYDGNMWIYDQLNAKVKKLNELGNVLLSTADVRLAFGKNFSLQKIIDYNGKLHLYDSTSGFYLFDYYGGLIKKVPMPHWQDVAITDNTLMGIKNNEWLSIGYNELVEKTLYTFTGKGNYKKIVYCGSYFLALTEAGIEKIIIPK
jgi:hypothetical protein